MIQNKKIILASQSPRRQELLGKLDVTFDIQAMDLDETYPPNLDPFKVPAPFLMFLLARTSDGCA